jgi:hypothetical protein
VCYLDPGPLIADLARGEAYRDHVHMTRQAADRIAAAVAELYVTGIAAGASTDVRYKAA